MDTSSKHKLFIQYLWKVKKRQKREESCKRTKSAEKKVAYKKLEKMQKKYKGEKNPKKRFKYIRYYEPWRQKTVEGWKWKWIISSSQLNKTDKPLANYSK